MIALIFATLLLANFEGFLPTSAETITLNGDGKKYSFEESTEALVMTGDNCHLHIGRNTGSVLITGNKDALKIDNNSGPVKYTGNGGNLHLGSVSAQHNVEYIGNNAIIVVDLINGQADDGRDGSVPQYKLVGNEICIRVPHSRIFFEVIGNDNNLMIQNNSGPVKYTGNDGHVFFGSESTKKDVTFIGDRGKQETIDRVGSC